MRQSRGIGLATAKSRCFGAKEAKKTRKNKNFGFWEVTHRQILKIASFSPILAFWGRK